MEAVLWPSKQAEQDLIAYLHWELNNARSARQPLERQWRAWLEQYRAPTKPGLKSFPYEGAANWTLPITATDVDQLYAKFMQSIHASPDLWIVQAMNEHWQDAAKPLQDTLSVLDRSILKMYRVNKRVLLEMTKLGTGIYEHGWTYNQSPWSTYDPDGKITRVTKIIGRPFVDHVRLNDFLIPPYSYAIQPDDQGGAPWVAKRVEITPERLMALAETTSPWMPNIGREEATRIIQWETQSQTPYDDTVQKLDYSPGMPNAQNATWENSLEGGIGGQGSYQKKIELWEFHIRWAMAGLPAPGGSPDAEKPISQYSPSDLVVLYHDPTQSLVRTIYQPYLHGQRPFEVVRFFPGDGFYGIGMCEQDEVFQSMGSELQNYLWDNVLLGNATMIGAKSGANIAAGEPIYPGKIWITDGLPGEEIKALQMGQGAYPGLNNMIALVDSQRTRRSGISDLQTGNIEGLPGRTPATSVQALLAEGNRRPDLTIKDMRYEGLSIIGLRIIQLIQQFAASPVDLGGKKYLQLAAETLGMPEGQYAIEKLRTPMENAELGLGVEIAAASATSNKDLLRQQMTALLSLAGQTYPQMIQMAQVAMQGQGTPVGQVATKALEGLSELFQRTLEQYDVRDTDALVPGVPGPPPASGNGALPVGPQPNGGGVPPGLGAAPGMGGVPQGGGAPVPGPQ